MTIATVALNTAAYTQIADGAYTANLALAQTWGRVRIVSAATLPALDEVDAVLLYKSNLSMNIAAADPVTEKIWGLAVGKACSVVANYSAVDPEDPYPTLPAVGDEGDVLTVDTGAWVSAPPA